MIAAAAVAVTVLAWASAFPAIRVGLTAFAPVELGAVRFAIAAIPAGIYLLAVRPALPAANEAWRFAFGGVVFVALYTVLLNIGELTVSAGPASFIINIAPVITALLAVWLLRERFPALAWVGTSLSLAGIGLIALDEGSDMAFDGGALFILGAAICMGVNAVVQKPLFRRHHALTVTAWSMVIGASVLVPALPSGLEQAVGAGTDGLVAVFYLALVPSLLGYATWAAALARLPAARVMNFLYCVPPVAMSLGFLWLGEVPGSITLAGCVLALSGVALVNLKIVKSTT